MVKALVNKGNEKGSLGTYKKKQKRCLKGSKVKHSKTSISKDDES